MKVAKNISDGIDFGRSLGGGGVAYIYIFLDASKLSIQYFHSMKILAIRKKFIYIYIHMGFFHAKI